MTVIDTPLPQEDIDVVAEHRIGDMRVVVLAVCYPDSPGPGHFEVHAGGVWLDEPFFTEPTIDEIQAAIAAHSSDGQLVRTLDHEVGHAIGDAGGPHNRKA